MSIPNEIVTGRRDCYQWLVVDATIDDLLKACPVVVLGKHIAITCFDSGTYSPDDEQRSSGWRLEAGIAYSPRLGSVAAIPSETYEEFYVFDSPVDLGCTIQGGNIFERKIEPGKLEKFVNFGAVHLMSPEYDSLTQLFWQQMNLLSPESYVAEGERLNFVTSRPDLFTEAFENLQRKL